MAKKPDTTINSNAPSIVYKKHPIKNQKDAHISTPRDAHISTPKDAHISTPTDIHISTPKDVHISTLKDASTPKAANSENESCGTAHPPDQTYAAVEGEHQLLEVELTQNQAYVTTTNITVETNDCYGAITPTTGLDNNQLYATVEETQINIRAILQSHPEDYDYVIA